jgi:hypothetical protein
MLIYAYELYSRRACSSFMKKHCSFGKEKNEKKRRLNGLQDQEKQKPMVFEKRCTFRTPTFLQALPDITQINNPSLFRV